jgi:poly(3-hydroxybutyrate) depolymerase
MARLILCSYTKSGRIDQILFLFGPLVRLSGRRNSVSLETACAWPGTQFRETTMLYRMNAHFMEAMRPVHVLARMSRQYLYQPLNPLNYSVTFRTMRASMELLERLTDFYEEPAWELDTTEVDGCEVDVHYEVVLDKPYCNLLHFRRDLKEGVKHPKVLMIAPLSGHYATLLRGTVREFLPDHDVYITDWKNARDVPMADGTFHFDDYVDYLIEMFRLLGPDLHVMAVCQPCVPALVAAAVMSKEKDPSLPASMTLMGGPVDVRINPTGVNDYASGKDLEWFEDNVICRVPRDFKGRGQLVYPGFIQLSGFMSMNLDTHVNKHFKFFADLVRGDGDSAEGHRVFYNEYLAVMDMPAHYYLDTIRRVFLEQALPKGEMQFRGHLIDLKAIENMALMTIEGELDDITGRGQTACALDLCANIPASKKQHLEEEGVGHYGIFNGRKFREMIAPKIKAFMAAQSQNAAAAIVAAPVAEPDVAVVEAVAAEPEIAVLEVAPAVTIDTVITEKPEVAVAAEPVISKPAPRRRKAVTADKVKSEAPGSDASE